MKSIVRFLLLGLFALPAWAFEPFVVQDIRTEGLVRISPGTLFSYLPIEKGDQIDRARAGDAIRALYKTGFFRDIQMSRQGGILVIQVVERPAISKITLSGNKDIKDEDLRRGLREIGLSEGETFDRLELDRLTQELTRQYNNRGKYNVRIKPSVTELDRNRVEITIVIAEGKPSKIQHINIVGNTKFSDEEIRGDFEQNTSNWLSWYKRDNQYSREKLSGDLEKLQSFYQDRGYVDFSIESTQVSVSPNKKDIFITANVREGEIYRLSELKLAGELILKEEDLQQLIISKPGEIFSRRQLELSSEAMTKVLANIGYAFADVSPIPNIDRERREVAVTFLVNPGKRVYVRRVNFAGNLRTQDEVLRREVRQFEGAWFSQAAIDRSKIRLRRLGFFKTVEVETPKVPGSEDQVDVVFKVEEQSSGAFQFGVGYSQLQGVTTSISVSQRNFLGTGKSVGVVAQRNLISKQFDFNFLDPYFTQDGVSVGYNLHYSTLDSGQNDTARYSSKSASGSVLLGLPLTETNSLTLSLGLGRNQIGVFEGFTPQSIIDYINALGRRTFNTWDLKAFWASDSRNKYFAPTRGTFQRLGTEIALPGSTQEYYKVSYHIGHYWPLGRRFSLLTRGSVDWGDGYGNSENLPFFENFYAGGVRDIRGFRDNTLGPCDGSILFDNRCQALGGSFKVASTLELIFPTPFAKRNEDSTQFSAFLDVGNVYEDFDAFSTDGLRASTGISFKWQAPVGPIVINLARPVRKKDGDQTETLQFSFGDSF